MPFPQPMGNAHALLPSTEFTHPQSPQMAFPLQVLWLSRFCRNSSADSTLTASSTEVPSFQHKAFTCKCWNFCMCLLEVHSAAFSRKPTPVATTTFVLCSIYLLNAPFSAEAPAAPLGFDDFGVGVEPLGEALVLAALPGRAHLRVTLVLQHPVETLGLQPAGVLVRGFAVTAGDLRQVRHLDLNLPDHLVGLRDKAKRNKWRWQCTKNANTTALSNVNHQPT